MSRDYNIILECGCMISLDGGGGLIPCCYPGYGATKKDEQKCNAAWKKYLASPEHKLHEQEIKERNE